MGEYRFDALPCAFGNKFGPTGPDKLTDFQREMRQLRVQ
jgi:hypothetical protein